MSVQIPRYAGAFLRLRKEEREDEYKARRLSAEAWAKRHFSERQVPWAVSAVLTRGPATASVVRAHLKRVVPGWEEMG